ncbi:unnamed protein product [Lathyrus oleraceus]|uniref:Uncharacterized protein n=1 Tax=Pisum sativum TaxID=3888 RepID=A0A9D4XPS4_PEA|nr:uncharacterized protein LOC127125458 [Pisum sativum]KAI5425126.1 hypothetical protein KIW84_031071 [Pisum sativum]
MIMMQSLKLNLVHSTTLCPRSITCITPFSPSSSITVTQTHHHQQHTYSSSSSSSSPKIVHITRTHSHSHPFPEPDNDQVEDLRVPPHWSLPTNASKESEWLRVTLHKWLDDEYCPEETNVEISRVAAKSYYNSLIRKQTDLSDILLNMAHELESISYKESFHGAFSSANAAVSLIAQRVETFCHPN